MLRNGQPADRPASAMRQARRAATLALCTSLVVLLGACSSGSSHAPSTTATPSTSSSTTTSEPAGATSAPATTVPRSTTTGATTSSTTTTCPGGGGSTAPFSTATGQAAALLTTVNAAAAGCLDRVTFGFLMKHGGTPSCRLDYERGPFYRDATGARVAVNGRAFVRVRCSPAYGYDFESGRKTYVGAAQITPSGTAHVRELVETGDNEGVLNWIIGLDAVRPYRATVATVPPGISLLTIGFS